MRTCGGWSRTESYAAPGPVSVRKFLARLFQRHGFSRTINAAGCIATMRTGAPSLRADVRRLDDRRPFDAVGYDQAGKFRRLHLIDGIEACFVEFRLDDGVGSGSGKIVAKPLHDFRRRTGRCTEAKPSHEVVAL